MRFIDSYLTSSCEFGRDVYIRHFSKDVQISKYCSGVSSKAESKLCNVCLDSQLGAVVLLLETTVTCHYLHLQF